jgi:hypothetical protein
MKKPSLYVILLSTIALIWVIVTIDLFTISEKNKFGLVNWDVVSYYSYLPATFVEKDITLSFLKDSATHNYYFQKRKYWAKETEKGNWVIKTTMGNALLYAPFFLIAHNLAETLGYKEDGLSTIYQLFIALSSVFYTICGLFFLRKILLKYYSELITSMGLLLVLFGTNLFYYAAYVPGFTHPNNFFLISVFLYLMVKWSERASWLTSILIGITIGLIALLRPTNALIVIAFPAFIIAKENISYLLKNWLKLLVIAVIGFLVCFPQMLYWKTQTDMWIYNSYVGETFFFDNPHVLSGMFSYRNGWLTYTPLMIFSIVGLFFLKNKNWTWAISMFMPPFLYVTYSWWCWWYGGSFGSRPMIDVYALLMLPICSFLTYLWSRPKIGKIVTILFVAVFFSQGIFFSQKKYYSSIHFDGMNAEVFWYNFWAFRPMAAHWDKLTRPDYDNARQGKEEF